MKQRLLYACMIWLSAASVMPPLSADVMTDTWVRIYRRSVIIEQKYEIIQNIVEQNSAEYISLLSDALAGLVTQDEPVSTGDGVVEEKMMKLIIQELGELKAVEAAPILYEVVEKMSDPFMRSDAIVALGRSGAKEFADEIALILRNLNLYRGQKIEGEYAIAYSCIDALERLKESVGFEPVFLAIDSGYSKKISEMASEALLVIMDDPTEILVRIITEHESYRVKPLALVHGERSKASPDNKYRLALESLKQSMTHHPNNPAEEAELRNLRQTALVMFEKLEVHDPAAVPFIRSILDENLDMNETIQAIISLQVIGGDEAAALLTEYLKKYNDKQESGVIAQRDEFRFIIGAIQALGAMKAQTAVAELVRAQFLFSGSISTAAKKAIEEMKQQNR